MPVVRQVVIPVTDAQVAARKLVFLDESSEMSLTQSVDGSGIARFAPALKAGAVGAGKLALTGTNTLLGRSSAGAGAAEEIPCTGAGRSLLAGADAAAQRATLGLGDSAVKNTGAAAGTVMAGDDSRVTTVFAGFNVSFTATAQTTNETPSNCGTYVVPDGSTVLVEARVAGNTAGHDNGAAYLIRACFRRSGATVTRIGTDAVQAWEDNPAWDALIDISSTSVRVRVTGIAATTINWRTRAVVMVM